MTSSFRLQKRFEERDNWSFDESPVGYGDVYIRPFGECHPDFKAHPIGHPEGVKVCVRRPKPPVNTKPVENGFFRYSYNLYDPKARKPTQMYNPTAPIDRRIPNESYLVSKDYISRGTRFNSTGLEALRTPECYNSNGILEIGGCSGDGITSRETCVKQPIREKFVNISSGPSLAVDKSQKYTKSGEYGIGTQRRFIQYANDWIGIAPPDVRTQIDNQIYDNTLPDSCVYDNRHLLTNIPGNVKVQYTAENGYDMRRINELQPYQSPRLGAPNTEGIWVKDRKYQGLPV